MSERFSDQFDFHNCEDEPIRTPGAIQSHGSIILLDARSLQVTGFSDNAAAEIERALGQPVEAWSADQSPLADLLAPLKAAMKTAADWPIRYAVGTGNQSWQVTVSARGRRLLLELEHGTRKVDTTVGDLAYLITRVKAASTVEELVQTAVTAVRSITGYDRVMVYRFAEDWHGEVIAESLASGVTGFLGLHFPATDIPAQARALYLENEIRMIANVDDATVPVCSLSSLAEDANPDLSDCSLRAVSPIHLKYLRNMGVAASMSISLVRDGKLWGLIACHHRTPRYVSVDARLSAKLVGDVLSLCLRLVEDSDRMKIRLRHNLRQAELVEKFVHSDELVPTLERYGDELRRLYDSEGFAVVNDQQVHTAGQCPPPADLLRLANHVRGVMQAGNQPVFSCSSWATPLFEAQADTAAGVLVLAPGSDYRTLVLWLRPEAPEQVVWAGKADKMPDDPLNPRASFARWSEQKRGVARAWKDWELQAAEDLLTSLQKLALRQLERLQRLSENLARSNKDLEDFAFIASHDLQEPLRKIEAFSSMIEEELAEETVDRTLLSDYLTRITSASDRLRSLVSDLLTYSRVGRLDYEDSECDWREILDKAIELLELPEKQRTTIEVVGEFPLSRSSPVLLRMVFQNLLSNALKYADEERTNHITVSGSGSSVQGWEISVADTGIGFDPDMAEAVFKPFLRLNSKSRYPGSGIGLAIVRKAAQRLGATVTAWSKPGEGSRFTVQLPPQA